MRYFVKSSDQLNKWSEKNEQENVRSTQTPCCACSTPSERRPRAVTGISDRAIQEVRQARLQMCQGARPRTEVLSVGQPAWRQARDDLRAASLRGPRGDLFRGPDRGPRADRGDLRDQPFALKGSGALRSGRRHSNIHRPWCGSYHCCQHDRKLSARGRRIGRCEA